MGLIFNIQRYCVQDGPGVRTTVFFKGCPLRCQWCSNPESQNAFSEVAHRDSLCNKCGKCADKCPQQAISLTENGIRIDRNKCNNCGDCINVCLPGAIKMYGEEKTVDEILEEVKRDKPFYENSGGGVTASGGDPLLQKDLVTELFKKCHNEGIHTCLETCGLTTRENWAKILPDTDLVLYDLKFMDSQAHKKATGQPNEQIRENLKIVASSGVLTVVRIPIIPGYNDTEENLKETANFVADIKGLKLVNLLQYHRLGESKYHMLDRPYRLESVIPPDFKRLEQLADIFVSAGLECEVVQ